VERQEAGTAVERQEKQQRQQKTEPPAKKKQRKRGKKGQKAKQDYRHTQDNSSSRHNILGDSEVRPPPTEPLKEIEMGVQEIREEDARTHGPSKATAAKKKRKRNTARTRKKKRQKNGNDTGTTDD
jgi:hypothetical protein